MKVHVHGKGILLVGKAWEIKQKLREYANQFETVQDWLNAIHKKYPS